MSAVCRPLPALPACGCLSPSARRCRPRFRVPTHLHSPAPPSAWVRGVDRPPPSRRAAADCPRVLSPGRWWRGGPTRGSSPPRTRPPPPPPPPHASSLRLAGPPCDPDRATPPRTRGGGGCVTVRVATGDADRDRDGDDGGSNPPRDIGSRDGGSGSSGRDDRGGDHGDVGGGRPAGRRRGAGSR